MNVSDVAELVPPEVSADEAAAPDVAALDVAAPDVAAPESARPAHAAPEPAEPVVAASGVEAPTPAAPIASVAAPAGADQDLARRFAAHAERARRQEAVRGWSTWLYLIMIAALTLFIVEEHGNFVSAAASALVCALSVAGGLMNETHRAQFDEARQAMLDCKAALLASPGGAASGAPWRQAEKDPLFSDGHMSFYPLFGPVFLVTFVLGLISLFVGGAAG
jgi:hypothetical protein